MTMDRTRQSVLVERYIDASPATVFSFFTSTERWLLWQGTEATIELRPGGVFRVNVTGDGFASGRFLEVEHNRRVSFTWGWEKPDIPIPPGASTVEIELVPQESGTLLRLTHTGLPPEWVEQHQGGWDLFMGRLADTVAGSSDESIA